MKQTQTGWKIILSAAAAFAVSSGAFAYHNTGQQPAETQTHEEAAELTGPQKAAADKFLEAFSGVSSLLSARSEVEQEIRRQQTLSRLSPQQQEAMGELFKAFPDATALGAALAAVNGRIEEEQQVVIAELGEKDLPVFGGADGEQASVVEFSDYQCGFCKRMFSVLRDENVRVKVLEFPILGDISRTAAQYALAAEKQGHYAEYHIALMGRPGRLTEDALVETAQTIGLDIDKLKADSQSEEITQKIAENHRLGRLLGVRGTPFLVVGGQAVPGAVNKERLRELLQ